MREIRELGIDPYPAHFNPTHEINNILKTYQDQTTIGDSEQAAQGTTPKVTLAGRLVLFRAMGKNAFAHIQDGGDKIQLMFNRDLTMVGGLPQNPETYSYQIHRKKDRSRRYHWG